MVSYGISPSSSVLCTEWQESKSLKSAPALARLFLRVPIPSQRTPRARSLRLARRRASEWDRASKAATGIHSVDPSPISTVFSDECQESESYSGQFFSALIRPLLAQMTFIGSEDAVSFKHFEVSFVTLMADNIMTKVCLLTLPPLTRKAGYDPAGFLN